MLTMTIKWREKMSVLMILSLIASFLVIPSVPVKADMWRSLFVTGGSLLGMYGGASLASAMGGGALAKIAGGIGGWILGGDLFNAVTPTSNTSSIFTGGLLGAMALAGGGLPGIAAGLVGGALLGGLYGSAKNSASATTPNIPTTQNTGLQIPATNTGGTISQAPVDNTNSQNAYNRHLQALRLFNEYKAKGDTLRAKLALVECNKALYEYHIYRGDANSAQQAKANYERALAEYNSSITTSSTSTVTGTTAQAPVDMAKSQDAYNRYLQAVNLYNQYNSTSQVLAAKNALAECYKCLYEYHIYRGDNISAQQAKVNYDKAIAEYNALFNSQTNIQRNVNPFGNDLPVAIR
ncbi:MAG: hypothetical protein HQM10_04000 [Candidatus Riflebacteria bacterium]|nr:hypothetical protein [Candidatus Riflebacteria bacterium]